MGQFIESGAHGPDEAYHKYHVVKSAQIYNNDVNGTASHGVRSFFMQDEIASKEFVVVLRPAAGDYAAREALRVYADLIEDAYPGVADDIRANMDKLDSDDPNPSSVEPPVISEPVTEDPEADSGLSNDTQHIDTVE